MPSAMKTHKQRFAVVSHLFANVTLSLFTLSALKYVRMGFFYAIRRYILFNQNHSPLQ